MREVNICILTICAILPISSVGTWCAILTIMAVLPVHSVHHSKSMRSVGIGDSDLRAARHGGGGHSWRNTVGTILSICTIVPVRSVGTWCAVLTVLAVLTVHTVQYGKGMRSVGIGDGDLCAARYGGGGHSGRNAVSTILAIGSVSTWCAILAITPVSTCWSLRPCITFFPFFSLFSLFAFLALFALRTLCPSCPGVALISFVTFIPLFALWTLCPGITFITLIALVSLVTFVAFGTTDALHAASERCG